MSRLLTGVCLGLLGAGLALLARHLCRRLPAERREGPWWWFPAVAGSALAVLGWQRELGLAQTRWLLLAVLVIGCVAADLRAFLLPDAITLPGTLLGLATAWMQLGELAWLPGSAALLGLLGVKGAFAAGAVLAGAGALLGYSLVELLRRALARLLGQDALGEGDSRFLLLLGSFLGPQLVLLVLPLGTLAALAFAAAAPAGRGEAERPFGPALAFGAFLALLVGHPLARWLLASQGRYHLEPGTRALLSLGCLVLAWALWRRRRAQSRR